MKTFKKKLLNVTMVSGAVVGAVASAAFPVFANNTDGFEDATNAISESSITTEYVVADNTVETEDTNAGYIFKNKAVAVQGVDVYSSADEGAEVVGKLAQNNIADVTGIQGAMTEVVSGNLKGYVKTADLAMGEEAEAIALNNGEVKAVVNSDDVNIYNDVSNSNVVADAKKDDEYKIIATDKNQVVVEINDSVGYVSSDNVSVNYGLSCGKTNEEIAAEEAAKKAAEEAAQAEAEAQAQAEAEAAAEAEEEETATTTTVVAVESSGSGLTKSSGVNYFNGIRETYYSSRVLHHYRTSEWTPDSQGFYRTSEGYYVVASNLYPEGTIITTSKGTSQVLDCGCDGIDFYVNW